MKAYPAAFTKVFWWALALLFASGLLLVPGMLDRRLEWEVPIALSGSRTVWAGLHGFFAFASAAVLGALFPLHIRTAWRRRRQLRSGLAVLSLALGLVLSGWGIYYIADERWAVGISVAHVLIGLCVALLLTVHVVIAKRAQMAHAQRLSIISSGKASDSSPPSQLHAAPTGQERRRA